MLDGQDPRASARVGSVLDEKWTLEALLGSGGMGAVYAARHRNGARSAVKVLHPELARIPEVRERFLREGYAANRVEHRGVVQVLDDDVVTSGADEGSAYLVMELLEGESLQDRSVREPRLTESELLAVMDAVLDVLAAAHAHGVIHRDLKPENVFLAQDPEREGVRVKVLDFGLARIMEQATVTSAGIAVGTPSFMSPEQAAGQSERIDGRSDLFALGATIFRIVTGRRIHEAENMVQLVSLMASVPAPPLRSIATEASQPFATVLDRALAFDRDDRYANAAEMQSEVRAALAISLEHEVPSASRLHVIPSSARNIRLTSSSEVDPASSRRIVDRDSERALGSDRALASERALPPDVGASPVARAARSATLPWVIVLVLLATLAWKAIPSVQEELVRAASPTAKSSAPPLAPPSAEPAASPDPPLDDAGLEPVFEGDLEPDASAPLDEDAAARPRVPDPRTTARPSVPAPRPSTRKPTTAPTATPSKKKPHR